MTAMRYDDAYILRKLRVERGGHRPQQPIGLWMGRPGTAGMRHTNQPPYATPAA